MTKTERHQHIRKLFVAATLVEVTVLEGLPPSLERTVLRRLAMRAEPWGYYEDEPECVWAAEFAAVTSVLIRGTDYGVPQQHPNSDTWRATVGRWQMMLRTAPDMMGPTPLHLLETRRDGQRFEEINPHLVEAMPTCRYCGLPEVGSAHLNCIRAANRLTTDETVELWSTATPLV
jgi:hypothetical protein